MRAAQSCLTLHHPTDLAHQALLPVGFSRQEYWSGFPFPPPGDLQPRDGTRVSCVSCIARGVLITAATWEAYVTFRACRGRTDLTTS